MMAQFQHPATRRGIKRAVISVADTMLKTVRSYYELGGSLRPVNRPLCYEFAPSDTAVS